MRRQHFILLAIVLVALLAARVLVRRAGSDVATSPAQAGAGSVLVTPVDAAAVSWVRVTAPSPATAPDQEPATTVSPTGVSFEKRDGSWVAQPGGAPADGAAIDAFVAKLAALSGEVRAEAEGSWAAFGVDEATAVKVEVGSGEQAAATVFVGKSGDSGTAHFVRAAGSPRVRHVRGGLRSDLGLWGSGASIAADLWIKKDVLGLTGADVTRMVVDRPGLRVVLEKPPAPTEAAGADGAPAPVPEPAWRVVEPALPWTVRADGLAGVVDRAATARVAGAQDPQSPACAAEPVTTVTFTRASGGDVVARLRGAIGEDAALTMDGAPHCWAMSSWSGTTLAPKASAIWDVPAAFADLPTDEPSRIRLERNAGTVTVTRGKDGQFTLAGARTGPGSAASVGRIASALRALRLDDVAVVPAGAKAPSESVTVEFGRRTATVRVLGPPAGPFGERFAMIEGGQIPAGWALVLSRATGESLLPPLDDLVAAP